MSSFDVFFSYMYVYFFESFPSSSTPPFFPPTSAGVFFFSLLPLQSADYAAWFQHGVTSGSALLRHWRERVHRKGSGGRGVFRSVEKDRGKLNDWVGNETNVVMLRKFLGFFFPRSIFIWCFYLIKPSEVPWKLKGCVCGPGTADSGKVSPLRRGMDERPEDKRRWELPLSGKEIPVILPLCFTM